MAKIKLAGKFPGEEQNGMTQYEESWASIPKPEPVYAIVRLERVGNDIDADAVKAAITQIEPIAQDRVIDLMREACSARGGFMAASADLELDGLDVEEDEL